MISRVYCLIILWSMIGASCTTTKSNVLNRQLTPAEDTLRYAQEVHLKSVKQLTFGGDNAEAYWSFDDKKVVFQATNKLANMP